MMCTGRPDRMSHRKWREGKQQPSRARSGHQLSCCLVSLHFLCDILSVQFTCKYKHSETRICYLCMCLCLRHEIYRLVQAKCPILLSTSQAQTGRTFSQLSNLSFARLCIKRCTGRPDRLRHRKRRETKQHLI